MWTPSESDMNWCANLLSMTRDGGVWGSNIGSYRILHGLKRIELVCKTLLFDEDLHKRNVLAFGRLGYAVVDETKGTGTA